MTELLSDAQLDLYETAIQKFAMFDANDPHFRLGEIIAQAKLANELQAKLVKARNDALEEAMNVCQNVAIEFGGYDPEGPSTLEAAHKFEGALACLNDIRALKGKP